MVTHRADSAEYGITTLAPKFWNGAKPDFLVSGPNVGANTGLAAFFSGTVYAPSAPKSIPRLT